MESITFRKVICTKHKIKSYTRQLMAMKRKFIAKLIAIVFLLFSLTGVASNVQSVENVSDENLEFTEGLEFHITDATNAIVNSTIKLKHDDAWLIFDNIKPSVVRADYQSVIYIGDEVFNPGVNGRIAIYKHGTAILPHGSSFKPLKVFSNSNYTGDSTSYAIHQYYTSLGDMDNAIQSFILKRGYMATFANNNDGSGYSRVFIADKEDLLIDNMPELLANKVSFIRVFKHQWITKKGWAGWDSNEYNMVNSTWFYDWNIGGNSSDNVEYATIRQNAGWPGWSDINGKENVTHLLGFNEPDRPDQSNIDFDDAIAMWPQFMKSGLRLGAPATSDPFNGWSLINFVKKCDELNYRLDYVAIHAYWTKSPQQWYNDLKYIHDRTGRPIWITEWNNGANWTNEWWPTGDRSLSTENAQKQLNDLTKILEVLDTTSFVERYSIYNWVQDCRAMILNGELTPAGEYYANNKSVAAFKSENVVVPHWNIKTPELSYTYISSSKTIKLSWNDPNGELTDLITIERKLNSETYEEIYSTANASISTYNDPVDPDTGGTFTYRIKINGYDGSIEYSNEVKYHKLEGSGNFQVGNFEMNSSDWETCLYSERYGAQPCVILGPNSNNNEFAYTNRVSSITASYLSFKLDPWLYESDREFTQNDNMSMLTMLSGVYDFKGLKGIAGSVLGVKGEWKSVEFSESFPSVPVVFFTQVTDNSFMPTVVKVRKVSTTGFEIFLAKEAAVAGNASSEKVSYLAIQKGNGIIDDKRIYVTSTPDSTVGDILAYHTIQLSDSYVEPVLFANLQTSNDDYASNIRYYTFGDNNMRMFKMPEESSGSSSVEKDKLGYMLIDLSDEQPLSTISEKVSEIKVYPNPVNNVVCFDFNKPQVVKIFDLCGSLITEQEVGNCLNVDFLPIGTYIIKVDGVLETKIVKL